MTNLIHKIYANGGRTAMRAVFHVACAKTMMDTAEGLIEMGCDTHQAITAASVGYGIEAAIVEKMMVPFIDKEVFGYSEKKVKSFTDKKF